ncbi:MAG: histidine kinase dimerization/phospho-acceptor domain-containing protein [Candidatus Omnitrophota bacterium]|jgi:signal transduction histidine kinase
MKLQDFIKKGKREFSVMLSLVGIIPLLVFIYIMSSKIAWVKVFTGEIGSIMILTVLVFILGIFVGKRMLSSFVTEIIEKDKKAVMTETALAVGHELNNPLLAIRGNLHLLESYISESQAPDTIRNRLKTIIDNFERIRQVTDKFVELTNPKFIRVFGKTEMLDINHSG